MEHSPAIDVLHVVEAFGGGVAAEKLPGEAALEAKLARAAPPDARRIRIGSVFIPPTPPAPCAFV